jgi:hypothetical protein
MSTSSSDEDNEEEEELLVQLQQEDQQEEMESSETLPSTSIALQGGGEKGTTSTRRLRWRVIPKDFSGHAGNTCLRDFLSDTNLKDVVFTRHLLLEKPYRAEYGTKLKNWDEFAARVNRDVVLHGQTDNVFGCVLTAKNCQARFSQLMDFVKKSINNVAFRSGDDSEAPPTELLTAIEQIYSDFDHHENSKASSKNDTLVGKERDKAAAEILRRSALGLPIPRVPPEHPRRAMAVLEAEIRKQNRFLVINDGEEGYPEGDESDQFLETTAVTPAGTSTGRRSRASNSGRAGASTPNPSSMEEAVRKHVESKIAASQRRADNKKRQLDMMQQRINMDKERLEMEAKREDRRMEMQQKLEERRLASEERMQTLLLASIQSNKNNQDNSDNKNK